MYTSTILKMVGKVVLATLLGIVIAPSSFAADLNYDADTFIVVNSVPLEILSGSHASRLQIGTNLIVDVPAGQNFFLVSRDGTALPNSVSINNEAQNALPQSCTQNAQGQSTENVLSIQGATVGTMRVTISPILSTPTVDTKCKVAGGGAQTSGGGGSGGGGVAGIGSTTSTGTLPPAPTIIPGVTTTPTTTAPAVPAPTRALTLPTTGIVTPIPLPLPTPPVVVATSVEIQQQTEKTAENTLDIVARAIAAAPAQATSIAPSGSGEAPPTPAQAAPIPVNVSQAAEAIAEKILPQDATSMERAITKVLLDNPPAAVEAKGKGVWGSGINSTRIANNGKIPIEPEKLKKFVENAALVVNGRFPVPEFKNPGLEGEMASLLGVIYNRDMAPGEDTTAEIADRNAIVIGTYGLRQQKQNMNAERTAAKVINKKLASINKFIKNNKEEFTIISEIKKNKGEYWNLVNAVANSGAKR
ncbi:MAG: hypothetical protein AAB400_04395 [Patescibacteria group bacterium]